MRIKIVYFCKSNECQKLRKTHILQNKCYFHSCHISVYFIIMDRTMINAL